MMYLYPFENIKQIKMDLLLLFNAMQNHRYESRKNCYKILTERLAKWLHAGKTSSLTTTVV